MFSIRNVIGNGFAKIGLNASTVSKKITAHVGNDVTNKVIQLLLMALLIPVAIGYFFTANTSGWDSTTVTIFNLIPVLALIGFAVAAYAWVKAKK